jgi:hypothetical protein
MKRFKPIELHTTDPKNIFLDYKWELSKKIIEAVDYALKNKKKKVHFAKISINEIVCITLSINDSEYLDVLDQNIENLIEFEDYETCAIGMKCKKILSKPDTN